MLRFDPVDHPAEALQNYHRAKPDDESGADALLYEFLAERARTSTCVVDIETTELIETKRVSIPDMVVSVASVLLVEGPTPLTFWNDARTGRGAPLRFLCHVLDHARTIVAYNGSSFDLAVLAQRDEARLAQWRGKLVDPYLILRRDLGRSFKLAALLSANGLEEKTAPGAEAPAMWKRWLQSGDPCELERLEAYNQQDVKVLAQLVQLPRVSLPGSGFTEAISVQLYTGP